MEAPADMGVAPESVRTILTDRALEAQHGEAPADLRELEAAIATAESAAEAGREEVAHENGIFDPAKFNQLAADFEKGKIGPWLKKVRDESGAETVQVYKNIGNGKFDWRLRNPTAEELATGEFYENYGAYAKAHGLQQEHESTGDGTLCPPAEAALRRRSRPRRPGIKTWRDRPTRPQRCAARTRDTASPPIRAGSPDRFEGARIKREYQVAGEFLDRHKAILKRRNLACEMVLIEGRYPQSAYQRRLRGGSTRAVMPRTLLRDAIETRRRGLRCRAIPQHPMGLGLHRGHGFLRTLGRLARHGRMRPGQFASSYPAVYHKGVWNRVAGVRNPNTGSVLCMISSASGLRSRAPS
jgi:hypothetical protein